MLKLQLRWNVPLDCVGAVSGGEDKSLGDERTTTVPNDGVLVLAVADDGHVRELLGVGLGTADDQPLGLDRAERDVDQLPVATSQHRRLHQRVHRLRVL